MPARQRPGPPESETWLGRQDSNLRMPASKAGALPLGDAPAARRAGSPHGRAYSGVAGSEKGARALPHRSPVAPRTPPPEPGARKKSPQLATGKNAHRLRFAYGLGPLGGGLNAEAAGRCGDHACACAAVELRNRDIDRDAQRLGRVRRPAERVAARSLVAHISQGPDDLAGGAHPLVGISGITVECRGIDRAAEVKSLQLPTS